MRFSINLATRTYLDHALINRILAGIALFLLLLSSWKVMTICGNWGEMERINTDIISLQGRIGGTGSPVSAQEMERQQKTIRFYNRIIQQKGYGWLELLERLENATPRGVDLISLARDTKSGTLKIEGRAAAFGQVRSYLEKLEGPGGFDDVLLISHAEMPPGERRGVVFSISCRVVTP